MKLSYRSLLSLSLIVLIGLTTVVPNIVKAQTCTPTTGYQYTYTLEPYMGGYRIVQSQYQQAYTSGPADPEGGCSAPATAPSVAIYGSPETINLGDSTTLTWASDATSCNSTDFATGNAPSGSVTVTPPSLPYTYNLSCRKNLKFTTAQVTINSNIGPATNCIVYTYPNTQVWFSADSQGYLPSHASDDTYSFQVYDLNALQYTDSNTQHIQASNEPVWASFTWSTPGTYMVMVHVGQVGYNNYPGTGAGHFPMEISSGGQTDAVGDQSEAANCRVYVQSAAKPNLTPGSAPTVTGTIGQAVTVSGTAVNTGNADAGSFTNAVISNGSTVTAAMNSLAQGASAAFSATFPASAFTSAGTYSYQYCVDQYGEVNESDEGDNCTTGQIVMQAPASPNLTAGAVSSVSATVGSPVSLSVQISNTGNADANSFPVLFKSTDGTLNANPGNISVPASGSVTAYLTYTFTSPGVYSVNACANRNTSGQLVIADSDTSNDCGSATSITVTAADLTAGSVSPATAIVGQAVVLTASASNVGNATSGSFPILFEIQGITLLGGSSISGLAPNGSGTSNASYTFSSQGTYQVRACANRNSSWQSVTYDSNTGDDCGGWTPVVVSSVPTASLSINPNTVQYGNSATLNWSCGNATSCAGTNFNTGGAMSGSLTVSPTVSTTYTVWSNGPGGTVSASQSLTVGLPTPDLTSTVGAAVSGAVNTSLSFTATVSNIGSGSTGGSFNNLIQICDGSCATYNRILTTQTTSVGVGQSRAVTMSATIPTPGHYYYRMCADADSSWVGSVTESNEGNNCSNWQDVIVNAPDLTASTVSPSSASVGIALNISSTISNIGGSASGSFPVLFQVQGGDIFQSAYAASLSPSGSEVVSASYTFASQGTYQVRACANKDTSWTSIVQESDYGNNCSPYTTVTVGPAPDADLTAGSVSPVTATTGVTVTLTVPITNTGNKNSGSFPVRFQPTSNQAEDVISSYISVAQGATQNATASFKFNAPGTYQVRACANYNSSWTAITTESNYGNNCGAYTTVTVSDDTSCSISVNPPVLLRSGGTTVVSWNSPDGTCVGQGFSTGNSPSGSTPVTVTSTSSPYFGVICTRSNGAICRPAPVAVTLEGCTNPANLSVVATPTRVTASSSPTVTWSTANTNEACTLTSSSGQTLMSTPPGACSSTGGGTINVGTLAHQTVYTLRCGLDTSSTVVNVVPQFGEF